MPRNPTTGIYVPLDNSWHPAVAGTVIDPDDWNDTQDDYVTALNEVPPEVLTGSGSSDLVPTWTGLHTFSNVNTIWNNANAQLSIGSLSGVSGSPYMDWMSSGLAADYDFRLQASGGSATSGTGTLTATGTLGVSNIVNSANRGIYVAQTKAGVLPQNSPASGTLGAGYDWNTIFVTDNGLETTSYPAGSRGASALMIYSEIKSGTGTKDGLYVGVNVTSTPSSHAALSEWLGIRSNVRVYHATPFDGSNSSVFGSGVDVMTNATTLTNVTGMELSTAIYTGGSSTRRSGISIVSSRYAAVQATTYDAAVSISAHNDVGFGVAFGYGILFSNYNGKQPVDSTSTIIGSYGTGGAKSFCDFTSYTFTDYLFNFQDGFGNPTFQMLPSGYMGIHNLAGSTFPLIVRAHTNRYAARILMEEDDAAAGPFFDIYRVSTTPAGSDALGAVMLSGSNSSGSRVIYAQMTGGISSPTAAAEAGAINFSVLVAGADTRVFSLSGAGIVISNSDLISRPNGVLYFSGYGGLHSGGADGLVYFADQAGTGFTRLGFGSVSSASNPSLARNSAALETKLSDNSAYAQHNMSLLGIVDGVTAPSATVGLAKIYVDTADGDLKVIFGDGTIKTIVVDT